MTHEMTAPTPKKRDDVLVSVGFTEVSATQKGFDAIKRVAAQLDQKYRYWEILVLADADEFDALTALFGVVPNLRLLKVRTGTTIYRRRIVLAAQAIGDVLAMSTSVEADSVDLVGMLETAINETSLVVSRRKNGNILDPFIGALGRASGFQVSSRDMQTVVYPRAQLDLLASRSDNYLALRFAPHDASTKVTETVVDASGLPDRRSLQETVRRLSIIQRLIVSLAPRVLGYLSMLSVLLTFMALLFVGYIFGVWIFVDVIQPGWITTSLLLSGTAAFLGLAIFCLASGMQMIIELLSPDQGRDVIEENSSVDLFSDVMTELNVDHDPVASEVVPRLADRVIDTR